MKIIKREHMVAKSGEVFYVENGKLHTLENIEEYDYMIKKERYQARQYFTFTVGQTHLKLQVVNDEEVMKWLGRITDLERRMKLTKEYFLLYDKVVTNYDDTRRIS